MKEFFDYLTDNYIRKPNKNNSYYLINAILNAANIDNIPERLEKTYNNPKYKISRVAYEFLAMNF